MTHSSENEQAMREAFAATHPEDEALLKLEENNPDFRVEAIGARHALAKFNEGWQARNTEIETLKYKIESLEGGQESEAQEIEPYGYSYEWFGNKEDYARNGDRWIREVSKFSPTPSEEIRNITPLYTAPPSAIAIETAAKLQAAESMEQLAMDCDRFEFGIGAGNFRTAKENILATIPQDGITELERLIEKSVKAGIRAGAMEAQDECVGNSDIRRPDIDAIVKSLIGEK